MFLLKVDVSGACLSLFLHGFTLDSAQTSILPSSPLPPRGERCAADGTHFFGFECSTAYQSGGKQQLSARRDGGVILEVSAAAVAYFEDMIHV